MAIGSLAALAPALLRDGRSWVDPDDPCVTSIPELQMRCTVHQPLAMIAIRPHIKTQSPTELVLQSGSRFQPRKRNDRDRAKGGVVAGVEEWISAERPGGE
jgi:hypothetical protein